MTTTTTTTKIKKSSKRQKKMKEIDHFRNKLFAFSFMLVQTIAFHCVSKKVRWWREKERREQRPREISLHAAAARSRSPPPENAFSASARSLESSPRYSSTAGSLFFSFRCCCL